MKKYKKGFLVLDFIELNDEILDVLKLCKSKCESLVVGIPADNLFLRMTSVWPDPTCGNWETRQKLLYTKIVDEVIDIDVENISIFDNYEQIQYDVYFYGQEYGEQFQVDKQFLSQHDVEMVSVQPDTLVPYEKENALWWALRNASYDRKVVLFGTGKYFEAYIQNYGEQFPPLYAIDNDTVKWGTEKQGVLIQNPEVLKQEDTKKIIVILCCKDYKDVLKQLRSMGDFDYRTMRYSQSLAIMEEYRVIRREEEKYLAKAHNILMNIMKEFDRVCGELGIHYYVISGSLIGVVRHQGLIPWDDDIDVAMTHHDYIILKEKAKEFWKDDFLFLDYDQFGKDVFYDFMTRIVYLKEEIPTGLFRKVKGKARDDIMNRLVLDIYVLEDAMPGWRHKVATAMLKGIYALAMGHRGCIDYNDYGRLSKWNLFLLQIVNRVGKIIPLKLIFILYEKFRGYARNKKTKYYFESNGIINYMPWLYTKELYGNGARLLMNDLEVMVPEDYHGLLKAKGYGNYMEYPGVIYQKPSHTAKGCEVIW